MNEGIHFILATCDDLSGNRGAAFHTVRIDKTKPTISASATKADNTPYIPGTWTVQEVTIHFTCADAAAGIHYCEPDIIVSYGMPSFIKGMTYDRASNGAELDFGPVLISPLPYRFFLPLITGTQ